MASPNNITEKLKELQEKFDLLLWQKVQNKFAGLMDVPVFTMDEFGNEMITSTGFPSFCKTIKSQPNGYDKCKNCWQNNFEEMCKNGQTIRFYKCHANLMNVMVPVVIGKQAIGAVVGCSITQQIKDVSACGELSMILNLDKHQLEDMLHSIKARSKEEIEKYGTLLYALSQTVPELIHSQKVTETMAQTDKLTGLYNRRYFMEALEKELVRSKRFFNPISLILLDVDHFGKYNNTMGHPMGDVLLKKMGELFKAYARPVDIVGRYGGEEFIVILPECTEEHALIVADRLRKAIELENFEGQENMPNGNVTVSVGCLTSRNFSLSPEELIKDVDKALYEAKNTGRNRVVQHSIKDQAIEGLNVTKESCSTKQ